MYHEKTTQELKARRRRRIAIALAFIVVAMLFWGILAYVRESSREQGATALRASILSAATRCYAIEGAYPASLDYLESRYGLRVNDRDYAITYEAFASNVVPSVVVVPR